MGSNDQSPQADPASKPASNALLVGVDTGGTFTDLVLLRRAPDPGTPAVSVHKVLSTPEAPEQAILQGLRELGIDDQPLLLVHGSTVATNAVLEGKGVRCALVTNRGFADLLSLGRQDRPHLYDLSPQQVPQPVAPEDCLEVAGRLAADGSEIEVLSDADLAQLSEQIDARQPAAVAVCLLFSYLNPSHEQRIAQALRGVQGESAGEVAFVSLSHQVLAECGEYERGIATWLNGYVGPLMQRYLQRLTQALPRARVAVMQSAANTVAAGLAGERAVHLLLSGPAGGLAAAAQLGKRSACPRLMSFDMGGTSTDVALLDARIPITNEGRVGPYPVAVPMVDMHTIGAGGGSLAYVDDGGLLQVGPQSAGADPGPACYGRGGGATVTDANLLLGRLPADARLGGQLALDRQAAHAAFAELGRRLQVSPVQAAEGVVSLANAHMVQALRVISVERGHDPTEFVLCCFGGAGGLHVCALAEALQMQRAMAPIHAGVLSALGMLCVAPGRQLSQAIQTPLAEVSSQTLKHAMQSMRDQALHSLGEEGIAANQVSERHRADLRYLGQSATLTLDWDQPARLQQAFHQAHLERFGHDLDRAVELVNLRLEVTAEHADPDLLRLPGASSAAPTGTTQWGDSSVPVWSRDQLGADSEVPGPAVIADAVGTLCVDSGWLARCDEWGNLHLSRVA